MGIGRNGAVLVAAMLALAACGDGGTVVAKNEKGEIRSNSDGSLTVRTAEGGKSSVAISGEALSTSAAEIAGLLPPFAPMYPGSTVRSTMNSRDGNGASSRVITLETRDSLADVMKFYDSRIGTAGATSQVQTNDGSSATRIVAEKDGARGTIIAVNDGGSFRTIVITTGQQAAG